MKIKYLLSPHFLEKSKILESIIFGIANNKIDLKSKIILDVGCGSEPYRQLFESRGAKYFGIDFKNYSKNNSFKIKKPDYYFSKTYSKNFKINNLSNNQFDIITSFQVLEHHERPDLFFKEANRLLKDKGYIIITFPFVWPLHEEPIDYHRLTHYKIKKLSEKDFNIIWTYKCGSTMSVINQIINTSWFNLKLPLIFKKIFYLLFLSVFQYITYFLEKVFIHNQNAKMFLNYTIILQKK